MILAAHQPQYLPWLGYLDKLDRADVFVLLDTVQFKKNEWQNRNRIKGPDGARWLTVPVRRRFPQLLSEVRIADPRFARKHRRSLETEYGRAPWFTREHGILDELYGTETTGLAELNVRSVAALARRFGIDTPIELGSAIDPLPEQVDERLIELCRRLGADRYLAGAGGRDYMDLARWQRAGIPVLFQTFEPPVYPQLHGGFTTGLSSIDLLFNCGSEGFARVKRSRKEAA